MMLSEEAAKQMYFPHFTVNIIRICQTFIALLNVRRQYRPIAYNKT